MGLRIRQIVFAARDLGATVAQFESVLGLQVAYRDPLVSEFGLENALLPVGDQFIEIVSPTRENTAAGRHLAKHGDSAYMLILQTDDIERDRARLQRLGVRTVWQADYPDIRATQIHPKDIGAAIVSLDQPMPPGAWRWAGPEWQTYSSKSGARRIGDVTVAARNPVSMAQRWSEVLGIGGVVASQRAQGIRIVDGTLNFVAGQTDVITDYRISMDDATRALATARSTGLTVTDRTVTLCGTRLHLSEQ